jgi:di/tricarboxylate transporter
MVNLLLMLIVLYLLIGLILAFPIAVSLLLLKDDDKKELVKLFFQTLFFWLLGLLIYTKGILHLKYLDYKHNKVVTGKGVNEIANKMKLFVAGTSNPNPNDWSVWDEVDYYWLKI